MEQQLEKLTRAILERGELIKQLQIQCEAIQASVGKMKPIRSEVQAETKPVAPVAADSTPMSTATGCTTTTLTSCLTPCPTHDADAPPPPSLPIGATSALLLLETTSMLGPTSVALPSASTPTSTCPQEVAPTPPTTTSMPDVTIISPEPTVTTIWVRDGTSGIAAYQQLEEMPLAPLVTVELDVDREGFCTPGMCMSIFSSLVNADKSKKLEPPNGFSKLTVSEAKRAFSGNLCRCTGYQPIVDVCKSFASDVDLEDLGLNIFWKKGGKQPDVSKLPSYTFGGGLCTFPDFLKSEIKSSLDYLNGAKSQSVPWPMFKCYEGSVQLKQPWPPPVPECIIRCVIVEMEVLTANLVAGPRHWVQSSKIVSYSSSCWQNSINAKTMRRCQETISELENCLKHELNIIVPSYWCWSSEDPTIHDKLLKRIILSSLTGNLAMFSGHEIFGYQVISTDQAVKLHPSCSLLIYGSKPEFVVFTEILSVPNQYLVCVTAVDHDAVCTIHPLSFIQRLEKHRLQMKVISGLGNSLLRKFCGKSAQNQQSIISFLKEDCRDERITIDIDFRNNEILLFATEDDMEKVFCIVNNALECEAKMLRNECLERSLFPRRHVNYTLALFGSGAEIKHLELEKRDVTVEVMHQNAHDINDRELIYMGEHRVRRIRVQVLEKILTFEAAWFDEETNSSGALCSRLSNTASLVKTLVAGRISLLLQIASGIIIAVTMGLVVAWKLALVMIALQPSTMICYYAKRIVLSNVSRDLAKAQHQSTQIAIEAVYNHRMLTSFGCSSKVLQLFEHTQEKSLRKARKLQLVDDVWQQVQAMRNPPMRMQQKHGGDCVSAWGQAEIQGGRNVTYRPA